MVHGPGDRPSEAIKDYCSGRGGEGTTIQCYFSVKAAREANARGSRTNALAPPTTATTTTLDGIYAFLSELGFIVNSRSEEATLI